MKISGYPVRLRHKPARLISDLLSLALVVAAFVSAHIIVERYPELKHPLFHDDFVKLWVFPAAALLPLAVYLFLIFSNHRMEKYRITEDNAQAVYDWYAFACSIAKLPVLVAILDAMMIYQARLLGRDTPWFSIGYIFYALILLIIIRFSLHRIRRITQPQKPVENSSERIKVTAKISDTDNSDDTKKG